MRLKPFTGFVAGYALVSGYLIYDELFKYCSFLCIPIGVIFMGLPWTFIETYMEDFLGYGYPNGTTLIPSKYEDIFLIGCIALNLLILLMILYHFWNKKRIR